MTAIDEFKRYAHDLIDQIDDENVMRQVNIALMGAMSQPETNYWDDLSEKDKAGIKQALLEAKDPSKCIPHEDVMRQFAPWRFK